MITAKEADKLSKQISYEDRVKKEFESYLEYADFMISNAAKSGYRSCVLDNYPWMLWDSDDMQHWSNAEPIGENRELFLALTEKQFSCKPACAMHRNGLYMPYGTEVSW